MYMNTLFYTRLFYFIYIYICMYEHILNYNAKLFGVANVENTA